MGGCTPRLYPAYGEVPAEHDRVELPITAPQGEQVRFDVVIRFATTMSRLRFDPSVAPMDFELSDLRLRRLGRVEALRMMLHALAAERETELSRMRLYARTTLDFLRYGRRVWPNVCT